MRRSRGAGPVGVVGARGYGCSRRGLIGGAPCGMGIWEFDASISDGLRGGGPGPDGWGVWVGITDRLGMGNSAPAAVPKGNAAGALGPRLRVWGTYRLEGVPGADTRGLCKAWDHPDNGRSILSLFERLAPRGALGGHPETSAPPHGE